MLLYVNVLLLKLFLLEFASDALVIKGLWCWCSLAAMTSLSVASVFTGLLSSLFERDSKPFGFRLVTFGARNLIWKT